MAELPLSGAAPKDALWLIRHGDRVDFADLDWARTALRPHDPGLSDEGVAQARAAASRLAGEGIARIFSSPYLRCVETAGHIARAAGVSVSLEPGLGELQHPDWGPGLADMLSARELERFAPIDEAYASRFAPRPPETIADAFARSAHAARALATTHEGPLLLVSHAVSIFGIVKDLTGYAGDIPCPVASLFRLDRDGGGWKVGLLADTTHLAKGAGAVLETSG